jgi:hypothetical protein
VLRRSLQLWRDDNASPNELFRMTISNAGESIGNQKQLCLYVRRAEEHPQNPILQTRQFLVPRSNDTGAEETASVVSTWYRTCREAHSACNE